MNWVDLFVIIVLLAAIANGVRRGLFREIVTLIAIVVGLVVAVRYSDWIAGIISSSIKIDSKHYLFVISFVGMFIIALAVAKLIGIALYKMASPASLKNTDKVGGALVGALKGIAILGFMFTLLLFIPVFSNLNANVEDSVLAPPIRKVVPKLYDYTSIFHPDNPTFLAKVKKVMQPIPDPDMELAEKEGEKVKTAGEQILSDVERILGDQQLRDKIEKR